MRTALSTRKGALCSLSRRPGKALLTLRSSLAKAIGSKDGHDQADWKMGRMAALLFTSGDG